MLRLADQQSPPRWSATELEHDRALAIEHFRKERLGESLEGYLQAFDAYEKHIKTLLETTNDLAELQEQAVQVLTDEHLLNAVRYLAGPPISADDLKVLVEGSLSAKRLREDRDLAQRVVEVVLQALDRRRFAWVSEGRGPTGPEREGAVLASAALIAASRAATKRRGEGKEAQERKVAELLSSIGFNRVEPRTIATITNAPAPAEFCGESLLGSRKADFVVTLRDSRLVAIECKVSNSSTNSVKRLNNDAAAKAEVWLRELGERQIVPVAVLSGVYKVHNLQAAQKQGLTLFWAHDLQTLGRWVSAAV